MPTTDDVPSFDLSDEEIEEFRRIYKQEFGEELKKADARMMAENLLRLYVVLAQPLPTEGSIPTTSLDIDSDVLRTKKPES